MLNKLFGGKKNEFYAQLDESQVVQAPPPAETAAPVAAIAEPAAKPEAVAETPAAPKGKKTSIKKNKTVSQPAAPATPAPAPVVKRPEPTQVEFATKYLITPTLSRRLPGPSLNKFKEMAGQIKTR